jgi:putative addiction module component (TIGR02574 family)
MLADLTREALELPAAQRLQLAHQLLDTAEPVDAPAVEVQAQWEDELEARLAAVKGGTAQSRPAAAVFADLDRRFPG